MFTDCVIEVYQKVRLVDPCHEPEGYALYDDMRVQRNMNMGPSVYSNVSMIYEEPVPRIIQENIPESKI